MRQSLRRAGAVCLLAVGVAACTAAGLTEAEPRGAEPAPPVTEVARVPIGPPPPGSSVLRVGVTPSAGVPLSYEARLEWGDKPAEQVTLGRFALHPVDQPGRFLLRVPADALRRAAASGQAWRLVLTARALDDQALAATPSAVAVSAAWAPEIR